MTVTVASVNDLPVANDDTDSTLEDTPLTIVLADLFANDSDADGDSLTLDSLQQPGNGSVVDNGDGTLTYAPAVNAFGDDAFTYTVTDGNGGFGTATVSIAVAAVNDAPVTDDESVTTNQDVALTISDTTLLDGDLDVDGDSLSITGFTQPAVSGGTVVDDGSSLTYTPGALFVGEDWFTYTVADGNGGTATGTVYVTVESIVSGPKLAFGDVVSNGGWQTVTLPNSYDSMVVVATPNYEKTDVPAVVRIRNTGGNSFEYAVQRATNSSSPTYVSGVSVHYTGDGRGRYDNPEEGYRLEVATFTSTSTDRRSSWNGQSVSYQQSYSNPVVVGQVMSFNDSDWSVFWASGSSRTSIPSSSDLKSASMWRRIPIRPEPMKCWVTL